MPIRLYNTFTHKLEIFKPIEKGKVGLYTCGPTVYNYAHIGNLRAYIFTDLLKRMLQYNAYKVKHVMNITDVGHLTSDADEGVDKMEKGSKREGINAFDVAAKYTQSFKADLLHLNISEPDRWCHATDHIRDQINLIKKLEKKEFTYQTNDGIYFDTSKFPEYGQMANLDKQDLQAGKRVKMGEKKNATDFALWKFSPPNSERQMEWESPWGVGFPGWHIECSAMSSKYLGQPFDIHTGGIDHIPIHHTNEIAQSEAANDKKLAHYWLHNEYLVVKDEKMAKSGNNSLTMQSILDKDIDPLAYRYFISQTHYRKQLSFSWEALQAAATGLKHLYNSAKQLPISGVDDIDIAKQFNILINDDLYIPGALALVWDAIKGKTISLDTLYKFDQVLGLDVKGNVEAKSTELPAEIKELIKKRNQVRHNKDWAQSDEIRDELKKMGYEVKDMDKGTVVSK